MRWPPGPAGCLPLRTSQEGSRWSVSKSDPRIASHVCEGLAASQAHLLDLERLHEAPGLCIAIRIAGEPIEPEGLPRRAGSNGNNGAMARWQ
jgi:hypothetical protein